MQKYILRTASLFAVLVFLLSCMVQAEAGPSYRKPTTSNPASDNWRYGLSVFLGMDQGACQKAYGANWPQGCASPALGEPGSVATGVEMTPATPGRWVWEGTEELRFRPEAPLKPNTRYQISLKRLPLSPRIKLSRDQIVYQTQPQAVIFGKVNTWIDPSPKGAHAISFPMDFIWPVNPQEMERRISVTADNGSSGFRLGEPRFVWNEDKDGVIVNVPVLNVAPQRQNGTLSVQGLRTCSYYQGERKILGNSTTAKNGFSFTGTSQMMKVERVALLKELDDNLNNRYTVELKTSLRLKPSDLLAKTRLIELPEKMEPGAKEPTRWESIPALSKEDEHKGRPVRGTLLIPDAPTDLVRFSVPIKDGRCLAVFFDNMVSESGLSANQRYLYVLRAPKIGSSIAFLQPGNILSLSGDKKIDLCATGVDKVEWKAKRIRDPFLSMMAKFRNFTMESEEEGPDIDSMSRNVSGSIQVPKAAEGQASFPVLDLAPILAGDGNGLMEIRLTAKLKGEEVASTSRLVLVSDLGLTVKTSADGSSCVFVQSILSGKPVQGATVRILGSNGLPVLESQSDANGIARLASANGLSGENNPVAIVAVKDKDLAWLSLSDSSRKLDVSDLATAGRHCVKDGLLASVFSQRGIYMPGETLHFGCIVRRFDWTPLPEKLPLEARITSPTGQTVLKKQVSPGKDGLLSLSWASPTDCPTGSYRLEVTLAGASEESILGEASVRIEEFEPDTLEMQASIVPAPPKGWIVAKEGQEPIEAKTNLKTLYGDAASGHRIKASFQSVPARLGFKGFEDYTFYDPTPEVSESKEANLPEQFADQEGNASFALPLSGFAGTFRGSIHIEGLEAAGGRAVSRQIDALFSPVDVIVGYKPQQEAGNLGFLARNSKASVRLIALNNKLEQIAIQKARLTISQRRYVNSLVSDTTGRYRYDSTPIDLPISKSELKIDSSGANVSLPTSTPGEYLLSVVGAKGEQLALIPFTVTGNGLLDPAQGDASALAKPELRLKLPKESFSPGESISFQITAPYEGTGLVTIERDSVVASQWFSAAPGESIKSISIPKDFEGKGYLCVSFRRSSGSDNIYLSPHVHAVAPFSCGVKQRDMGLSIDSPKSVLPGSPLKIKLSSKRPGRALLFAVDEGVLSLTSFRTPNPLQDLLCDRALDVTTRQAFDLLMPEHARLKGRIPAFGGGMSNTGGRFLNPFRRRSEPPFAVWQGVVETSPAGSEISIPVPEYLSGKIRIMAVGSSADGSTLLAGNAQSSATVRGTVILRPALPLAAAPGDIFDGAVTVANTIEGSGKGCKISLSIIPDSALRLVNSVSEKEVEVDENGQFTVPFKVKVQNTLGPANLRFTAKVGGSQKAVNRTQSISVRPLAKSVRVEQAGPLAPNGGSVDTARSLYPYNAKTRLSVAPGPASGFSAIVERLEEYPYSCTEQTVSKAFPYAAAISNKLLKSFLGKDASSTEKQLHKRIEAALASITSRDTGDGISLWDGSGSDDFVTVYSADFLVTLAEGGKGTRQNYGSMTEKLESIVNGEPLSLHDARTKAYAAWVLLRMGELTQGVEKLENWLNSYASPSWRNDITAALIADCRRMQRLDIKARELAPANISFEGYDQPGSQMFTIGVAKALFLGVNAYQGTLTSTMVDDVLDAAFSTTATTAEMGLSARALAKIDIPADASGKIRISCEKYQQGFDAGLESGGDLFLDAPGCERFMVETNGANIPSLYWHSSSEGFERKPLAKTATGLRLSRRYLNAKGEAVTEARVGDVLTVELSIAAGKEISNVALVDLLPGGLEPVMEQPQQDASGLIRFERREDRGIFFVDIASEPRTFKYKVRAVTSGSFLLPQCHAEAMYRPSLNASDGEGFFNVLK